MTPTRTTLLLVLLLVVLTLLGLQWPLLSGLRDVLGLLLPGALLLDLLLLRAEASPEVVRRISQTLPIGVQSRVALQISNRSRRPVDVSVHDHHPADFSVRDAGRQLKLPTSGSLEYTYAVTPMRRGDHLFSGVDVVIRSRLGFWQQKRYLPIPETCRVFPNFRAVGQFALLASDRHLNRIGIRSRRRRGEGSDFHQLRDYRVGDSLRQINWKATSRYRKLISKEYQDEQDQQVMFLLDCGRRMRHAEAEGVQHIDQALNAMLLLAHVATRQGDAVGMLTFGGVTRWHPPAKGGAAVTRMLTHTYDIQATTEAADYLAVVRELMPLQRRRALIILITNTRDEDSDELAMAVRLLGRRHLVLVADLREQLLDDSLSDPIGDLDAALRFHALHAYLAQRKRQHEQLRHQGILALDLLANQLPVALVNQYRRLKASARL